MINMLASRAIIDWDCRTSSTYTSFKAFLEIQTELFVESMQDAADNQWHKFLWSTEGASEEEVGHRMEKWWSRKIYLFRNRLRLNRERDRRRQLQRRLDRKNECHHKDQLELEANKVELHQVKGDLAIERGLTQHLKEQRRCRDCNSKLWE